MKTETVTVVRIYVREGEHLLERVVTYLHDEARIAGLTVLRGIEGFAEDGTMRQAWLVDLSLDLPLVIEFYDVPERVEQVLHSLVRRFPLAHVIRWQAERLIAKAEQA
jgi:PII-like signaling protein